MSDSKLVSLPTAPKPNAEAVDLVRKLLSAAESGEVQEVAIVALNARGIADRTRTGTGFPGSMYLMLHALAADLLDDFREDMPVPDDAA